MGESTFTVNRTEVSCFRWAMENPHQSRHMLAVAVLFGAVVGLMLQGFTYATRPPVPILAPGDSARVTQVEGGGHLIALHYFSARSVWCTRQIAELAATDEAEWDGKKMNGYYGLAFNQNGPGMYYGTADEYVLWRYLPPGLPIKKWQYIVRVRHECSPWGLIHWSYTSPPREIEIP